MSRSKRKFLFVVPEVPYPPRAHGISIRYLPMLTRFAAEHDIDLVMINDEIGEGVGAEQYDASAVAHMQALCRRAVLVRRDPYFKPILPLRALTKLMSYLPQRTPHDFITYDRDICLQQIESFIGNERYDTVVWATMRYGEWLLSLQRSGHIRRVVLDMVDSLYLHRQRGTSGRPYSSRALQEARFWESKMINSVDAVFYISPVDAAAIPREMLDKQPHVIPNGVYTVGYSDKRMRDIVSPSIGFLGNMSYEPNIEGVLYLYRNVFLPLKQRIPDLSLWIIGRNPGQEILALAATEGVHVTGAVEDIWPYVNAVDVFVLPLQSGTGQQNKILEVMMAGRPVVTTTIANGGIGGHSGRDLLVSDEPEQCLRQVEELLRDPGEREALGARGRDFVSQTFEWNRIYERMAPLVMGGARPVSEPLIDSVTLARGAAVSDVRPATIASEAPVTRRADSSAGSA